MRIIEIAEIRNWILLIVAFIGAYVTIKSFRENNKQRKIDNTFKTLDYLRRHIGEKQIQKFIELFQANNPITSKENEFKFSYKPTQFVEDMFSEGGCGNGEIYNMVQVFDLVSISLNKDLLETELVWYEYGQMISKCYDWTSKVEKIDEKRSKFLSVNDKKYAQKHKSFYYNLNNFMENNKELMTRLPTKMYTDIE